MIRIYCIITGEGTGKRYGWSFNWMGKKASEDAEVGIIDITELKLFKSLFKKGE
jgi:hypothetical protein